MCRPPKRYTSLVKRYILHRHTSFAILTTNLLLRECKEVVSNLMNIESYNQFNLQWTAYMQSSLSLERLALQSLPLPNTFQPSLRKRPHLRRRKARQFRTLPLPESHFEPSQVREPVRKVHAVETPCELQKRVKDTVRDRRRARLIGR